MAWLGKGSAEGEGTARELLRSQLTGGGDKEGKPGALSTKSSEMARVGLAASHWMNRILCARVFLSSSIPDLP